MKDFELRDVFEKHIKEQMLGPGATKEVILCSPDCSDEILDNEPLRVYSTGILHPKEADAIALEEIQEMDSNVDGSHDNKDAVENTDGADVEEEKVRHSSDFSEEDEGSSFKPDTHMGLVTCLTGETTKLNVKIKYAKYNPIKPQDYNKVKILVPDDYDKIDRLLKIYDDCDALQGELKKSGVDRFSSLIAKDDDNKSISLQKYVNIDTSKFPYINDDLSHLNDYLRMLFRDLYQREPHSIEKCIDVSEDFSGEESNTPISDFSECEDLEVFKKVFCKDIDGKMKKYVKIIIRNAHKSTPNTAKYAGSIFQPEVIVEPIDGTLDSYTEPIRMKNDQEGNTIDFIYRDAKNYGKGILCAVEWDDAKSIKTAYMPTVDVKKFSSKLDKDKDAAYCQALGIDAEKINDSCNLYNLSHWQTDNVAYFERLHLFVNGYGAWCKKQASMADGMNRQDVTNDLIGKQKELLDRLNDNVNYLERNKNALDCFKWANTAMLIQMTVARNEHFKKNRDITEVTEGKEVYESLNWFRDNGRCCWYFPFQLAFLLMNVKSTFEADDKYRNEVVDLIWFPTGGGKTEAYLALTALTIIARRRSDTEDSVTGGVSVLMRYTLRMLTSQQFERASYLICALEFLRNKCKDTVGLGNTPISIGLWIGGSQRKYRIEKYGKWRKFNELAPEERVHASNPYPVAYCPWCGQKLVPSDTVKFGYVGDTAQCTNSNCFFHDVIPVHFVTEDVESTKPTLLFATVDKLAGLTSQSAAEMFGYGGSVKPLDLIIQDELHLISGPLGSMVGFFESVVEKIATKDGHRPKIIASTATTRNTGRLIQSLYNNREVRVFPAQGITYDDNFFSHIEDNSLRRHMGIYAQCSPVISELRLAAHMLLARVKVIREELMSQSTDITNSKAVLNAMSENGTMVKLLDNFWSQVFYYNSLKDLGRMHSRIGQEVMQMVRVQKRYMRIPESLLFLAKGMDRRVKEFTSREDSSRIKDLLTQAQTAAKINTGKDGRAYIDGSTIDIVLASNMISVGIDIDRWNVMLMSGQPRSISEYIQSSSRVGRSNPGLVINEYSPTRIREKSMFENFTSFHSAYYKYVEPLSATPVTMQTLCHPVFNNIVYCFKNYFASGMAEPQAKKLLLDELINRFNIDGGLQSIAKRLIESKWDDGQLTYAQSLRDIDNDCYMSINQLNYN